MEQDNSNTNQPTTSAEEVTFTPAQQEAINKMMATERRKAEIDWEAIRTAALAEVNRAKGVQSSISQILAADAAREAAEQEERTRISVYFGKGSSGAAASRLMKDSPENYRAMKKRAAELGLIADIKPQGTPGKKAFSSLN